MSFHYKGQFSLVIMLIRSTLWLRETYCCSTIGKTLHIFQHYLMIFGTKLYYYKTVCEISSWSCDLMIKIFDFLFDIHNLFYPSVGIWDFDIWDMGETWSPQCNVLSTIKPWPLTTSYYDNFAFNKRWIWNRHGGNLFSQLQYSKPLVVLEIFFQVLMGYAFAIFSLRNVRFNIRLSSLPCLHCC